MARDDDKFGSTTRRGLLLTGVQGLLFAGLAGRMYQLQILEADRYVMLSDDNRINLSYEAAPRGLIVDRYGRPMARNRKTYRVSIVREDTRSLGETLASLARIVPLDQERVSEVMEAASRHRAFVPIPVYEDLSWEQIAWIGARAPSMPGVRIDEVLHQIDDIVVVGLVADPFLPDQR
ncbi:MAG: hypothetical protein MI861_04020, partial [Pirellulales bacterium]|nr:hypothetical protein [Pirellulales bacterium]